MSKRVYLIGNVVQLLDILVQSFQQFRVIDDDILNAFHIISAEKIGASLFQPPQLPMEKK
jgi:hypothetical protein